MARPSGADVRALPGRIESLLDGLHAADEATAARADQLVAALLQLYGSGLERIVELLDDASRAKLAGDDLIGNLLLLHDCHPVDLDTRILGALDRVRPYLGSHAGGIEYLGVDDEGTAHLRLTGQCDHCPASSVTVRESIEKAIWEAAPDLVAVDVDNVAAPSSDPADLRELPLLQISFRHDLSTAS